MEKNIENLIEVPKLAIINAVTTDRATGAKVTGYTVLEEEQNL